MKRTRQKELTLQQLLDRYLCLPLLVGEVKVRPTQIEISKSKLVVFSGFHPETRKFSQATVALPKVVDTVTVIKQEIVYGKARRKRISSGRS